MKLRYILGTALFATVLFTSCEDVLKDPTSAEIAYGLEGQWAVDQTSSLFPNKRAVELKSTEDTYRVYITVDDSDSTLIYIEKFYQLGDNVFATARVTGYNLNLTQNQTLDGGFTIISGSGTINKNLDEIELNYTIDDGSGELDQVEAIYTFMY